MRINAPYGSLEYKREEPPRWFELPRAFKKRKYKCKNAKNSIKKSYLDVLSRAIRESGLAVRKLVMLVNPNGITKIQQFTKRTS